MLHIAKPTGTPPKWFMVHSKRLFYLVKSLTGEPLQLLFGMLIDIRNSDEGFFPKDEDNIRSNSYTLVSATVRAMGCHTEPIPSATTLEAPWPGRSMLMQRHVTARAALTCSQSAAHPMKPCRSSTVGRHVAECWPAMPF